MRGWMVVLLCLMACQAAPIVRRLKETTLFFTLIAPTGSSVLYSKSSEFDQPTVGVKSVQITGKASMEGLTQPIVVVLFARAADPATACISLGSLYRCPASAEVPLSSTLTFSPESPTVSLNLSSNTLIAAANQGKVWLGLRVVNGAGETISIKFSEMRATVTLL
jgi:hypothetical protein